MRAVNRITESDPAAKRRFFRADELEEYRSPMWQAVAPYRRPDLTRSAAALMKDAPAFGSACRRVTVEWPKSTEAAITTPSLNYQAWIGHAASALVLGCPEDLTRQAWRTLSDDEQRLANEAAMVAINAWRAAHAAQ